MSHDKDDRSTLKNRRCLRCQESFESLHAGNRICPVCAAKPVMQAGLQRTYLDFFSSPSESFSDDEFDR